MWLPGLVLLLGSACRTATAEDSPAADFLLIELSLGKFKTVLLNRTVPAEAVLRNIASNVTVIIFQIHTHQKNAILSFDKKHSLNNSGTGVDRGLVSLLRPQQTVCTWYLRAADADQVLSTAVALSYTERDPIPGGCNLEFDLDIDSNIYLEYNLAETNIKFAPANIGYPRYLQLVLTCKEAWDWGHNKSGGGSTTVDAPECKGYCVIPPHMANQGAKQRYRELASGAGRYCCEKDWDLSPSWVLEMENF